LRRREPVSSPGTGALIIDPQGTIREAVEDIDPAVRAYVKKAILEGRDPRSLNWILGLHADEKPVPMPSSLDGGEEVHARAAGHAAAADRGARRPG
jgi:hypothetical protein